MLEVSTGTEARGKDLLEYSGRFAKKSETIDLVVLLPP